MFRSVFLLLAVSALAACGAKDSRAPSMFPELGGDLTGSGVDVEGNIDSVPELVPADSGLPDSPVALDILWPELDIVEKAEVRRDVSGPGGACLGDGDCDTGLCIELAQGPTCALMCMAEADCPEGHFCMEAGERVGAALLGCIPLALNLCRPCDSDLDCQHTPYGALPASLICVSWGPGGHYCAVPCSGDVVCPESYECAAALDAVGEEDEYCLPEGGECHCTPFFVAQESHTTCWNQNESGSCPGFRQCTESGFLSECFGAQAEAEQCNGADDDCDGDVDEDVVGGACEIKNMFGICAGVEACVDGSVSCVGPEATEELCNEQDDDCDGQVDEWLANCPPVFDEDGDGWEDNEDNCEVTYNPGQEDFDGDLVGDVCDPDDDNDLVEDESDCAPFDVLVYPGAFEGCDGEDNNCDGVVDEGFEDFDSDGESDCIDTDDDGDGDPDVTDCQPQDPEIHTGAVEECNGVDDNCDGVQDEGQPDLDQDGVVDCLDADKDGDGVEPEEDCDDTDGAVYPEAQEICDGKDNDCNGESDEALSGVPCSNENEFGLCSGLFVCQAGEGFCKAPVPAAEACDGKDNNCDGEIDEGAGGEVCSQDNAWGECFGIVECNDGQGLCTAKMPSAEVCDGLDNNCDGQVDEGLGGNACANANGFGQCVGVDVCADGVLVCEAPVPGPELCDLVDNNCDGEIDEEAGGQPCQIENEFGACPGATLCLAGEESCDGPLPSPEVCDEKDNDCDGIVDEQLVGDACAHQNEWGTCEGQMVCSGGEMLCDAGVPAPEECDGVDNNCSGQVDEGLGQTDCGLGQCLHSVANCLDGEKQVCDPIEGASDEVCDGVDNSCDGQVDEGLGETSCGLGQCEHTVVNCLDGEVQLCDPMKGWVAEVCDGVDNDCDGQTDEGLGETTCGLGKCEHTVANCVDGELQGCDPMEGSTAEACDGLDNDCNGQVDDDLGESSCGLGECEHSAANCVDGEVQGCDPMEGSTPEACDGLDNDCDGEEDEGFPDFDEDGMADCVDPDDDNDLDLDETDCSPLDATVHHLAAEVCYNGVDDDCNQATADECILRDCAAILESNPALASGDYTIDPDEGGAAAPFPVRCDMETDGGGWIALSLSKSSRVIIGQWGSFNPWLKCADDGAKHFSWIPNEGSVVPDYSPETVFMQDVELNYERAGSNYVYTAQQEAALRGLATRVSSETRMVAVTADDDSGSWQDGASYGHEVYVMDAAGIWKLLTPGTNGECGGGTIWPTPGSESAFYLWATDSEDCETDGQTGLWAGSMGGLPANATLPQKVRLVVQTGGGVAFGWEEEVFLVR